MPVKNGQHSDDILPNDIEDAVWEATDQQTANVPMYDRVQIRCFLDFLETLFYAEKKVSSQTVALFFKPKVCFLDFSFSLGAD